MSGHHELTLPQDPKLTHNLIYFVRALRKAGLPIGSGRVMDAVRALNAAGFTRREDFFYTLRACFVSRPEHLQVFAQIFRLFWRDPRYLEHMMAMLLPTIRDAQEERIAKPGEKRAAEALLGGHNQSVPARSDQDHLLEIDAAGTASGDARLRSLDFEQMSTEEIAAAKRMLSQLNLPVRPLRTRRYSAASRGERIDARRMMQTALRRGGELNEVKLKKRRLRWPNLVVICDISGSMSQYSRMVLHFLHAVANHKGAGWARIYGFTFGTELTNITRHLAQKDVDAALAEAGRHAQDWEGGTRIGESLRAFNRDWSRRVLGQGAVVLLITDGLERGDPEQLARETERLRLSARHLIWLNPLLRWDGFAPRAAGIAAMLPHIDSLRSAHSVASLEGLAQAISRPDDAGEKVRLMAALER